MKKEKQLKLALFRIITEESWSAQKKVQILSVTYVLKDTTEEMFLSYLKRLENNGYIQYANNIIDDSNLYTTYTKDHTALTVYYTKHNQCTRIVSEPKTTLPAPSSENVYEKKKLTRFLRS